jgi:hypothetical protein
MGPSCALRGGPDGRSGIKDHSGMYVQRQVLQQPAAEWWCERSVQEYGAARVRQRMWATERYDRGGRASCVMKYPRGYIGPGGRSEVGLSQIRSRWHGPLTPRRAREE